jgi:agmatine deiminase
MYTNLTQSILPREAGYRMPAEWEPHEATWLSWPHKLESWPDKFEPVPQIFVEIVKYLCPHERVNINVKDVEMEEAVKSLLRAGSVPVANVQFHHIPTNDAWARDHGPIFITRQNNSRSELAIVDWKFNAWGGKYPPYDLDDVVPTRIAERFNLPLFTPDIIMEGGSIDVNGKGTLLTTESCLLNKNRNPHLNKEQIEEYLKTYLGVTHILWLGDGIVGDDTDGHIDDLTRFVNPTTLVTVLEDDPSDENYELLLENYSRLQSMKDQDGKPFNIVTLPMPGVIEFQEQRLPASYANFYIANNVVLVPTYNHANDKTAISTLQSLFPNRRVVGIDCTDLVWGLGAIHCVTQQQPKVEF